MVKNRLKKQFNPKIERKLYNFKNMTIATPEKFYITLNQGRIKGRGEGGGGRCFAWIRQTHQPKSTPFGTII